MRIRLHNVDRLNPETILKSIGEYHYFADTKMRLMHGCYDADTHRVHLVKIDQAFDPKVFVDRYTLDFSEAPNERLPEAFDELLGRFPRASELYASLSAQKWVFNEVDRTFDAYRTPTGVLLMKQRLRGDRIWSPFVRVAPLEGRPAVWTRELLVRAAHNGQYSRMAAYSCVTPGGTAGEGPSRLMDGIGGMEFARALTEDSFYRWSVFTQGDAVIAEGTFSTERTDRFELTPDYL